MIQILLMEIWSIIQHVNWNGILGFAFSNFFLVVAISSGFFPKSDLLLPLCRRLQPYTRAEFQAFVRMALGMHGIVSERDCLCWHWQVSEDSCFG